jgi:REP element-mobilizing transposase RayT
MARRPRDDTPGSWHHVLNRAIARRPLFEDRDDVRYFLSRLAREVRRERIEVHAWCILTTHYHLLVRSLSGELSEGVRRVQSESSRRFNRRHRRDGPLVRGRFLSKPVRSSAYRWNLVRYIDANAVRAGLVRRATEYPFGSAWHYARPHGPRWIARWWIEQVVEERARFLARASDESAIKTLALESDRRAERYELAFPPLRAGPLQRWVEQRIDRGAGSDPLDRLVGAAPARIRRWMSRKARLADGSQVGQPLSDAASISSALRYERWEGGRWTSLSQRSQEELWSIVEVGLQRDLAASSWTEIARSCRNSVSTITGRHRVHARLMNQDHEYAQAVAEIAARLLNELHGNAVLSRRPLGEYGIAADSSVARQRC